MTSASRPLTGAEDLEGFHALEGWARGLRSMSEAASDFIKAMRKKDLPKVRALLGASAAAVNTVSPADGGSPFHVACRDGRRDFALLFLEHGANVTAPDPESLSPLQLVIGAGGGWISTLSQAQVDERTAVAEALLQRGAKLTDDLLLNACQMGGGKARKLAAALLARGAPLTGQAENGATVLHSAVEYDHPEVFAAALKKVPVDAAITSYPIGNTALHLAAKKKSRVYIEQLVAAGARSDLVNARKETARTLAPKALLPLFDGQAAAPPKPVATSPTPSKNATALLWRSPTDPQALSVFADWLQEEGQETRAEFIQLSVLPKPTALQQKKKEQLLKKHRGAWLGAARKVVSSWEDSVRTPGFVARATVPPEKLVEHFELVRMLGPELVVTLTAVKTRLLTKKLAELPLGSLFGLELRSAAQPKHANADWLDDIAIELLAPALKGLRSLSMSPEYQLSREGFTAKSLEVLAPVVGSTLESLTLGQSKVSLLGPLTPQNFPALKALAFPGAEPDVRRKLTAQWKGRGVKFGW